MISTFSVPWPPKQLQPNSRLHWSKKVKPRAAYKQACWAYALQAGSKGWKRALGNHGPNVGLVFHPPNNQRRDIDNCLAAFKAGLDGIALACGIDDHLFGITLGFGPAVKGGSVAVKITKLGGLGVE